MSLMPRPWFGAGESGAVALRRVPNLLRGLA
jgi:hypothetical protein